MSLEDLAVAPLLDRGVAVERAPWIIDDGITGEEGNECGGIMRVDGLLRRHWSLGII